MTNQLSSLRRWLALGLMTGLCLSSPVSACTVVPSQHDVPRNFAIRIVQGGEPVPSIQVKLVQRKRVIFDMLTDSKGYVYISDIPAGEYDMDVGANTVFSDEFSVVRVLDGKTSMDLDKEIVVPWAGKEKEVLRVRRFFGAVRTWEFDAQIEDWISRHPMSGVRLTVREPRSGLIIAEVVTSSEGDFDFPPIKDGLYALELVFVPTPQRLGSRISNLTASVIPLDVSSDGRAFKEGIDLLLNSDTCGWLWAWRPMNTK